ncbi:hypothetical protein [Bradyrhizobium guangdongense]|uniref:CCHC-type domain-containing protein n=1 Tax=Bradyrhizobium guangdongense TaxID=1325090 RepID=A0A410VEW7_9BRAD|nr:hypothetical protein [Bradyrhizobium guangdongense]QAU42203.1 hypothetical protein X265_34385 [Bradyrhizobium guangdongense]QOZ63262.1 hypothetical protein XH86_34425 [Bradyrhizobium guangdongense]GGI29842.1 hypothetical protein GCM10010987_56480 [Bradyrhizobium guangdongense]
MDYDVEKAKRLIEEREEIDRQLVAIFSGGASKARAAQKCSKCGKEGHTARTCTDAEGGGVSA